MSYPFGTSSIVSSKWGSLSGALEDVVSNIQSSNMSTRFASTTTSMMATALGYASPTPSQTSSVHPSPPPSPQPAPSVGAELGGEGNTTDMFEDINQCLDSLTPIQTQLPSSSVAAKLEEDNSVQCILPPEWYTKEVHEHASELAKVDANDAQAYVTNEYAKHAVSQKMNPPNPPNLPNPPNPPIDAYGMGRQLTLETNMHNQNPSVFDELKGVTCFFTDCEQDMGHYRACYNMCHAFARQIESTSRNENLDVRIIFGGDSYDIESGDWYGNKVVSAACTTVSNNSNEESLHSLVTCNLVENMRKDIPTGDQVVSYLPKTNEANTSRYKPNEIQHSILAGNRDINKLRLLWDLPDFRKYKECERKVDKPLKDVLKRKTFVEVTQWAEYNNIVNQNLVPLVDELGYNVKTSLEHAYLLCYIKLCMLLKMTFGAGFKQSRAEDCDDNACGGFMNYFLNSYWETHGGYYKEAIETLRSFYRQSGDCAATMNDWYKKNKSNSNVCSAAGAICMQVFAWIAGTNEAETEPSSGDAGATGTSTSTHNQPNKRCHVSMRTYLEEYSGLVDLCDFKNYRVMAVHAGVKSAENDSILFKVPSGISEESNNVIWAELKFDQNKRNGNGPMNNLVNRWCQVVNIMFRNLIKYIYRYFDKTPEERLKNTLKFTFKHEFETTNPIEFNYDTAFKMVCLLAGPNDQGFANCAPAVSGELVVPTLSTNVNNQFKSDYMTKPTTWLSGHIPFRSSIYSKDTQSHDSDKVIVVDAMRVDTQYKRPSYAVAVVMDRSLYDNNNVIKQMTTKPSLPQQESMDASTCDQASTMATTTTTNMKNLLGNGWIDQQQPDQLRLIVGPMVGANNTPTHRFVSATHGTQERFMFVPLTQFYVDDGKVSNNTNNQSAQVVLSVGCIAVPMKTDPQSSVFTELYEPTSNQYLSSNLTTADGQVEETPWIVKRSSPLEESFAFQQYSIGGAAVANTNNTMFMILTYATSSDDPWFGKRLDPEKFKSGQIVPYTSSQTS